ncbi:hypothetical protein GQ53DRAFT_817935 [Thozetella sp. PMI_491]|nr:hypothetical protein GQ53DRAFT_817935 [Thozetella sp. PMI_491]
MKTLILSLALAAPSVLAAKGANGGNGMINGACPTGQTPCDSWCMEDGGACCKNGEGNWCDAGFVCTAETQCVESDSTEATTSVATSAATSAKTTGATSVTIESSTNTATTTSATSSQTTKPNAGASVKGGVGALAATVMVIAGITFL